MADKQVQIRKGTTAQNNAFTGALGEMSFDTEQKRLRTHDGATLGGFPHALQSEVEALQSEVETPTFLADKRINGFAAVAGASPTGWLGAFAGVLSAATTTVASSATEATSLLVATGAISGDASGYSDTPLRWSGRNNYVGLSVKPVALTNIDVWVGIFNTTSGNFPNAYVGADPAENNYAAFRFVAGTDTNWMAVSKDATAQEITDTGVAFAVARTKLEVFIDDTNSQVRFYVNGTLVATHTVRIPSSGGLVMGLNIQTQENLAKTFKVEKGVHISDF